MSDITAEKRLALIRSIREENTRNRLNLRNRQRILYGHGYDNYIVDEYGNMTSPSKRHSTLGIRILAAIAVFSVFVILDYTKTPVSGLLWERLGENYPLNIVDFMENITYTLDDV